MANSRVNRKFGLVGKNISYSFSQKHFSLKFKREGLINCQYDNYDLQSIREIVPILKSNMLSGLNVTIPYKRSVMPYLDFISPQAEKIGAVNTICWDVKGRTIGHNTDCYGFEKSLLELTKNIPKKALILGTGGAAAAVSYVLQNNNVKIIFVSRNPKSDQLNYDQLTETCLNTHSLIINTTPLGTFPNIDQAPPIPYSLLNSNHFLFDLIYNPKQTLFLKKAAEMRAKTQNGYQMLVYQAEKSWKLWNQ